MRPGAGTHVLTFPMGKIPARAATTSTMELRGVCHTRYTSPGSGQRIVYAIASTGERLAEAWPRSDTEIDSAISCMWMLLDVVDAAVAVRGVR